MTNKRTIVFLAVNASYSHTSLALRSLDCFTDRTKWNSVLHEITIKDNPEQALKDVEKQKPDVLAATFYLFNRNFLTRFLNQYKELHPECTIICGGPEFLGNNEAFLRNAPYANAVVRGEGEHAFSAFLNTFETPGLWHDIPGFCFLQNGTYIDNGFAETVQTLDDIPFPYRRFPAGTKKPFVHLETSRGCSNGCKFCVSANTAPVRFLSTNKIIEYLDEIAAAGVKSVRIIDRTFNEKPARAKDLINIFRERFPNIRFHLEIDPARLPSSLLNEMEKAPAGTLHMEAGVQSFNRKTLSAAGRLCTPEATRRGLTRLCAMKNVEVHADLIAGLPYSTLNNLLEDLKEMVLTGPDEIQLELLKILPGTPFATKPSDFGLHAMPNPPYAVTHTTWMSTADITTASILSALVDRFYNASCMQSITTEGVRNIPDFWSRLAACFSTRSSCLDKTATLENRFEILDSVFSHSCREFKWKLQYAWMKEGLSAHHGICKAVQIKGALPFKTRLIEGESGLAVARTYMIEADNKYLFVYGKGRKTRRACAIYELQSP